MDLYYTCIHRPIHKQVGTYTYITKNGINKIAILHQKIGVDRDQIMLYRG